MYYLVKCARILLCLLLALALLPAIAQLPARAYLAEFNRSDALFARYIEGLTDTQIITLKYTPSDNPNSAALAPNTTPKAASVAPQAADAMVANEPPEAQIANKAVELNPTASSQHEFIALLQVPRNIPQGGLLIIHDMGQNADWPYVIKPAREFLPEKGWMTLSIAIPKGRVYNQHQFETAIYDRIKRAHEYLQERGQFNLVFIASGSGAYWASKYLNQQLIDEKNVGYNFIFVNGRGPNPVDDGDFIDSLMTLNIPMMDLFVSHDPFDDARAKRRKGYMLSQEKDNYIQVKEMPVDSNIRAHEYDRVTRRIWGWLKSNAQGGEATISKKTKDAKF